MNKALSYLSNKYLITADKGVTSLVMAKKPSTILPEAQKIENILFGSSPDKPTFLYRLHQYGQLLNAIHFSREFVEEVDPIINYLNDTTWFTFSYDLQANYLGAELEEGEEEFTQYSIDFKPAYENEDDLGINTINLLASLYVNNETAALELKDLNKIKKTKFYTGPANVSLNTLITGFGDLNVLYGNYVEVSHWKEEHWDNEAWANHWLDENFDGAYYWHIFQFYRPKRTLQEINETLKTSVDIDKLNLPAINTSEYIKNMILDNNVMYSMAGYCCALIQSNINNG